jgi:catechol 2,3-dioxygenase-like lactoylglutathione lyase family enzyme
MMGIERIEELLFGVTDLEACGRFYEDLGLEAVDASESGATYRTLANQRIHLRRADDPTIPQPLRPPDGGNGSTLREVTWGVDTQATLDAFANDLSSDREVRAGVDSRIHTVDESGYHIAFAIKDAPTLDVVARPANVSGSVNRWNQPLEAYERARPIRICHLALDIEKEGREKAQAFYEDRLRFRPVDVVVKMGTFMQAEGDWDQHTFLLVHRSDAWGINHAAFEVRDFDEVVEGGNFMLDQGWEEARYVGRHTIGSNVYRFFHNPCGGRVEFVADMDRVDESYETPRVHEETPPHHLWLLKQQGPRTP